LAIIERKRSGIEVIMREGTWKEEDREAVWEQPQLGDDA
jgi:hypothetical protein